MNSAQSLIQATALVIDDEPNQRAMLQRELSMAGFDVTTAESGAEALALMQRQKFDVALTEMEMPDMDGLETFLNLREKDPGIEVVIAGMDSAPDTITDCLRRGVHAYTLKPYNVPELTILLNRAREARYLHASVLLYQLGQRLLTPHSHENLAQGIVELAAEVLSAETAVFGMGYPLLKDDEYHCADTLAVPIELAESLAQQAYVTENGVRITGGLIKPGVFGTVRTDSDFHSALVFPLKLQGQLQGTLIALRTTERPDFTAAELELGEKLAELVTMALENERLFKKLQNQAITDEVTGLFSRRFLFETIWQLVKRLGRAQPAQLTCVMLKAIQNGQLEPAESDKLRRKVAQTLCRHLRGSDVVARYAQDEYVAVLPQTDMAGGHLVAKKLLKALRELDTTVPLTIHMGLSSNSGASPDQVRSMKDASDLSTYLLSEAENALRDAETNKVAVCP